MNLFHYKIPSVEWWDFRKFTFVRFFTSTDGSVKSHEEHPWKLSNAPKVVIVKKFFRYYKSSSHFKNGSIKNRSLKGSLEKK